MCLYTYTLSGSRVKLHHSVSLTWSDTSSYWLTCWSMWITIRWVGQTHQPNLMTCLHTSIRDDVSTHVIKFLFLKKIVSWRGHSFWLVKKLIKKKWRLSRSCAKTVDDPTAAAAIDYQIGWCMRGVSNEEDCHTCLGNPGSLSLYIYIKAPNTHTKYQAM